MSTINNGYQTHFVTTSKNVDNRPKKKNTNLYFISLFILQFILMIGGFIGILFYMDMHLKIKYKEINDELKTYNKLVNDRLRDLCDTKKGNNFENLKLQASESHKFIAVTLDSVDEYPIIEEINENKLILNDNSSHEESEEVLIPSKSYPDNHSSKEYNFNNGNTQRLQITKNYTQNNNLALDKGKFITKFNKTHLHKREAKREKTEVDSYLPTNSISGRNEKIGFRDTTESLAHFPISLDDTVSKTNEANGEEESCIDEEKLVAAHFEADISKFPPKFVKNYIVRHPSGNYVQWMLNKWFETCSKGKYFSENTGIKILRSGLYYVYAQIYYSDEHVENGYRILKNNKPALICVSYKSNTCYTGGILHFKVNDLLEIKDFNSNKNVSWMPEKSFFGFFKHG